MKRGLKYFLIALLFLGVLLVLFFVFLKLLPSGGCIAVIQPAKNRITGEVKDFPTPCAVPFWYEPVSWEEAN
jgi:hypothetical protein